MARRSLLLARQSCLTVSSSVAYSHAVGSTTLKGRLRLGYAKGMMWETRPPGIPLTTEVWAQLWICSDDCLRIRELLVSEGLVKPSSIIPKDAPDGLSRQTTDVGRIRGR